MNELLELVLKLATVVGSVIGSFLVVQFRLNRADKDRDGDLKKREKDLDQIWERIHAVERSVSDETRELDRRLNDHEKEALKERIKISEQFTEAALANVRLGAEVKSAVQGISRMEAQLLELSNDLKHQQQKGGARP